MKDRAGKPTGSLTGAMRETLQCRKIAKEEAAGSVTSKSRTDGRWNLRLEVP